MQKLALSVRPLPLVIAILMGVLGTGLVAYKVWDNQYRLIQVGLLQERQQALQLLAAELEGTIQQVVSQTLRYLFTDDDMQIPGRIEALKRRFPALDQVLRFDADGGMLYCIPGPSAIDDYRRWLSTRLQHAVANRKPHDLSSGSFVEKHEARDVLFVYAPIPQDLTQGLGSGWIVLRYSLDKIVSGYWQPLRANFMTTHGGKVNLTSESASKDKHLVHEPVSRYLNGWILEYQPDAGRLEQIARDQGLLLGLLIIGFGSLPIAVGVVYWWYSRKDLLMAQAKAEFVAHVSHELKTPLSLIRMYAETLEMSRIKDPDKTRQYLQTILQESDRLTALIDQVLDYARMEKGKFHFRLVKQDLTHTVEQLVHKFRPRLEQKGYSLKTDIASDIPLMAHDEEAVSRVLLNLIDNAMKFSTQQKNIHLSLHQNGHTIVLQVSDRGKGIPDGSDKTLFQPFTRGPDEDRHQTPGAGLGLAMVQHAVNAHGGKFELNPRSGGGTNARIILPLYFQPQTE